MTIEQFDKTAFTKQTLLKYKGNIYHIGWIDFREQLFGLLECQEGILWVRCENVEVL